MRMIPVKDLEIGHVIGKSIYGLNNKLMLGTGYRITADIKQKLLERGYAYVYIKEEGTDGVTPQDIISDEVRLLAVSKFSDKAQEVKQKLKFRNISITKIVK